MSAPTAEDTDTTDATDDLVPWDGTLIQEDTPTGDNRRIDPEALQWDTPLTLRYVRQDMGEHDGAEAIGRIDEVWRDGNDIRGRGVIDAGTETGAYAVRQIEQGIMTGVSADLDDVAFEIRDEGNQPAADEDAEMELMMTGEGVMATTSARIRAATLVQVPAFKECTLQISERSGPVQSEYGETSTTSYGESLAARRHERGTGRVLAVDWQAGLSEGQGQVTARAYRRGPTEWESAPRTSSGLGEYAGSDPAGPDDRSSLQEHDLLQPAAHGDSDQRGEPSSLQPGTLYATSRDLWVWAPVHRGQHSVGEEITEGWFHLPSADVSAVSTRAQPKNVSAQEGGTVKAGGGEGLQTTSSAQSGTTHHATVTAASQPTTPPSAWFADPGLHEPSPLAVTEDGYVYGHLASWGVCHASEPAGPGTCVTAPSSETGYSRFHTGTLVTSDNRTISVGKVTMGTNHAPSTSNPKATAAHYDHTGTAVADVRAGEDAHGIWVAGALRPEVTDEQIRALRASPLSGDWRKVDGNLELHAALAVNVPGFPIPRPAGMVSSGELSTIVASGMVAPRTVRKRSASGDTLTDEDLAYLKKLADRERSNERTALAQRVQDSRTAVNRRRVESFATKRKG